jgi:hypothetical protein
MVGSKVIDLWSRYSGCVSGTPQRMSSACSSDSMLLQGKQPTETPLKLLARSNGRIKSYRPVQLVFWTRRWYDLHGHHRHGVGIPRYSKENSLLKLLQKFGRDPTVGSKVIDILSRYSGHVDGTHQRMLSACISDSSLLKGKQPTETPQKGRYLLKKLDRTQIFRGVSIGSFPLSSVESLLHPDDVCSCRTTDATRVPT